MRVLDLFSGIGGFSLGLERAGMETVAFCEYDKKAQLVLSKHWPDVPQYHDVKDLTKEQLDNDGISDIGLICGGYPCQPFSVTGKREGKDDDRHLWPEFFRLIKEIRPTWVIAENVAGHINMGLEDVLADLESEAYQCQTFLIPACAVGAVHRRDRIWILAYSDLSHGKGRRVSSGVQKKFSDTCGRSFNRKTRKKMDFSGFRNSIDGEIMPKFDRNNDGVPGELDFLGGLDDEVSSGKKTDAEANQLRWAFLRAMWEHRESAKASQDTYIRGLRDSVPDMPYRNAHERWVVGARFEESQGMRDLWADFYSKPFKEAQDMQQTLLERIRQEKRPKALASRADRLKQLGNAVVPQIPEFIGRSIMEIENGT
jgi:DNA (cytosine-5)-methyltransferase 1